MNEKSIQWFMAGGILLLLLITVMQSGETEFITNGENMPKISVTGAAEKEVLP